MDIRKFTASLIVLAVVAIAVPAGAESGFLDDYSKLTGDSGRKGAMAYRAEGVTLANYDKIAMTPIEIWLSPQSKYKGLSADDLRDLSDVFAAEIRKHLEPAYPIVSEAGPGVLQIRIAIANVKLKKKKRGLLSFTPAGFALTTLKDIAGLRIILDTAVIEAELTDSESGEVVALLVDDLAKSTGEDEEKDSWDKVQKAFAFYANRFRQRLDSER